MKIKMENLNEFYIKKLEQQVEQLQAENARLREVLVAISDPDSNHPAFIARHAEGKRLDEVYEDMAGEAIDTDSANWLAEHDAKVRREVLEERKINVDALMEQAQVFASAWSILGSGSAFEPENALEIAEEEKAELRRMAEQPESK